MDSYWYIVLKFKQFSECFKVEDFVPYINHMIMSSEFKLSSIEKHSKYLKAFLKGIYDLNKEEISMLAFPFTRSTESKHGTYLCHLAVLRMYRLLHQHNKLEEALFLHLTYALSLSPSCLYLLKYESIDELNKLVYWNPATSKYCSINLKPELANEINVFKGYRDKYFTQSSDSTRVGSDESMHKGYFIFNIKPSSFYNKFKNGFGGIDK